MFERVNKPSFSQVLRRTTNIWGTHIELVLPKQEGRERDVGEIKSTRNSQPGMESLRFYDEAYTAREPAIFDVSPYGNLAHDSSNDNDYERLAERDDVIARRRFYYSNVFCEYGQYIETWWCDLWIHRNPTSGNLYEPDNLKHAHHEFLRVRNQTSSQDSEDGYIDDYSEPEPIEGVTWTAREYNSVMWQGFSEYLERDGYLLGQSWLIPLGETHYLQVRFYRMNCQFYSEFQEEFTQFTERCMELLTIELPQGVSEQLSPEGWTFTNEPFFTPEDTVPMWFSRAREFESALKAGGSQQESLVKKEATDRVSLEDERDQADIDDSEIEFYSLDAMYLEEKVESKKHGMTLSGLRSLLGDKIENFLFWLFIAFVLFGMISSFVGIYMLIEGGVDLPYGIERKTFLYTLVGSYVLSQVLNYFRKKMEEGII